MSHKADFIATLAFPRPNYGSLSENQAYLSAARLQQISYELNPKF